MSLPLSVANPSAWGGMGRAGAADLNLEKSTEDTISWAKRSFWSKLWVTANKSVKNLEAVFPLVIPLGFVLAYNMANARERVPLPSMLIKLVPAYI